MSPVEVEDDEAKLHHGFGMARHHPPPLTRLALLLLGCCFLISGSLVVVVWHRRPVALEDRPALRPKKRNLHSVMTSDDPFHEYGQEDLHLGTQLKEIKSKFQSLLDRLGLVEHRFREKTETINDDISMDSWATELEATSSQIESLERIVNSMQEQIDDNRALLLRGLETTRRRFWQEPLHRFLSDHSDHDASLDDEHQLIPYFLGNFVDANDKNTYPRRYLIDLGSRDFIGSPCFFLQNYPAKFDAISYAPPAAPTPLNAIGFELDAHIDQCVSTLPKDKNHYSRGFIMDHLHLDMRRIGLKNDKDSIPATVSFKNFMHSTAATVQDFVVVKMDLQGLEFDILESILEDRRLMDLIDEIFVDVHYHEAKADQSTSSKEVPSRTLAEAWALFEKMRDYGVFIHPWPRPLL